MDFLTSRHSATEVLQKFVVTIAVERKVLRSEGQLRFRRPGFQSAKRTSEKKNHPAREGRKPNGPLNGLKEGGPLKFLQPPLEIYKNEKVSVYTKEKASIQKRVVEPHLPENRSSVD